MTKFIKKIISQTGDLIFFFKKKEINKNNIRKILIISLYFRGDVLFNTPSIKILKKLFPDSAIDVLVKSRSKDILKGNPDINELIVFDNIKTADYNDSTGLMINEKLSLIKRIRKEKYDLCIDFTGKYSTGLIALLGGFKYSMGLNYNGFGFCYSKFVNIDTQNTIGHLSEKYSNIIKEGLSINVSEWISLNTNSNKKCEIFISKSETEKANHYIKSLNIPEDKPLICIQITAGWKAKEWSEKKYSELLTKLLSRDYSFVLIGSEEDKSINFRVLDSISPDLRKFYLSLPLKINAAVIRDSDVFIGSDSIGLHLAGAVNTPSIGIFGPTNPAFSNPAGEIHTIIYNKLYCSASDSSQYCTRNAGKTCATIDCIKNITPDQVMKSIDILLNKYFYKKELKLEKN
ncbi:MAG: glycosyltransferase family 9 protein [Ignavibacteria bacterium]